MDIMDIIGQLFLWAIILLLLLFVVSSLLSENKHIE